jgi:hypothetical protein
MLLLAGVVDGMELQFQPLHDTSNIGGKYLKL